MPDPFTPEQNAKMQRVNELLLRVPGSVGHELVNAVCDERLAHIRAESERIRQLKGEVSDA